MHACLSIDGTEVDLSDGMCSGKPDFKGFQMTLVCADDAQARRRFYALADGGQVQVPIGETFFASSFGMLADRFGVGWMVMVPKALAGCSDRRWWRPPLPHPPPAHTTPPH